MDISIFEVIGPIMLGPSSSGTAGMARIGATAHKFLTAPLKAIHITLTPRLESGYIGFRSHFGLIGGAMGLSESDPQLRHALELAREQGIELSYDLFIDPVPAHMLTIRLRLTMTTGEVVTVMAVSVGGGSIELLEVDGHPVHCAPTASHVFIWSAAPLGEALSALLPDCAVQTHQNAVELLTCVSCLTPPDEKTMAALRALHSVRKVIFTPPFVPLGLVPHQPLFTTCEELVALSRETGKDIAELAIAYEMNRSGRSEAEIYAQMAGMLEVMKEASWHGLNDPIQPLCGFNKGNGGKLLFAAANAGKTMGGATLSRAIARALGTMEYSMALGRVVAAPTGGSCGIVPGCLLTVQEERGFSDEALVRALFVCAAMGVVMYYHGVSFSGSQGGCQGEVGVSSAMAAGGLAYLAGVPAKTVTHAMALALKNILGLICDPLKACDEVPCIKRNGIGVANAFSGADMAIAGIESYIPPDEVIESLAEVERIMPVSMRGSGCGARGTKTGLAAEKLAMQMSRDILLPRKA